MSVVTSRFLAAGLGALTPKCEELFRITERYSYDKQDLVNFLSNTLTF